MKIHRPERLITICLCFFLMLTAFSASAQISPASNIIYVTQNGTSDGSSWTSSTSLSKALQWAQENKDLNLWNPTTPLKIYVAKGIHTPNIHPSTNVEVTDTDSRRATFLMVKNVQLYGGFDPDNGITDLGHNRVIPSLAERFPANSTVLSGDLDGNDDPDLPLSGMPAHNTRVDNAYHVVLSVDDVGKALLDGFIIRDGYARNDGSFAIEVNGKSIVSHNGGGLLNVSSSPALTNVTISKNGADNGSGMYSFSSSSIITNVTFSGNEANLGGGGMYNETSSPILTDVMFSSNEASTGGGMTNNASSPILTNVTISENTVLNYGGGMYNWGSSSPALINVEISRNKANGVEVHSGGGGMYNESSSPILTHVTIGGNEAIRGGGMYNSVSFSKPQIYNSIIYGNKGTGGSFDNIKNSDIDPGTPAFQFSLIEGAFNGGNWDADFGTDEGNNLSGDPLFTNAANGDYTLRTGSPAINKGNTALVTLDRDLVGNTRVRDGIVDMGAYEYQEGNAIKIGRIIYVKENATGSGSSWSNSMGLADALQWAQANKDNNLWDKNNPLKIFVAKGTYLPKYSPEEGLFDAEDPEFPQDKTFLMVKNVQLYGGFNPEFGITELSHDRISPTGVEGSILSGDFAKNDGSSFGTLFESTRLDNAYHVVLSVGDVGEALLDGFIIKGGNAITSNFTGSISVNGETGLPRDNGGGILNWNSVPTFNNVMIAQNRSRGGGGGMANLSSSSPVLSHVIINGNNANSSGGGGMYNSSSSPTLTHVTISKNIVASGTGGGMHNVGSSPTLTNVVIKENQANASGGGISNYPYTGSTPNIPSSPTLTNVLITGNKTTNQSGAFDGGGGIFNSSSSATLTNVTISENEARGNGGGMLNYGSSSMSKTYNSIIHGNKLSDNSVNNIANISSATSIFQNSLIEGAFDGSGDWIADFGTDGSNNIADDPLFTNAANGDYTLQAGSPAINKGNNALVEAKEDLAGNARIRDNTVDMGAYEVQSGNTVDILNSGILYVKANGTGDGSSWDNPLDLADALQQAREHQAEGTAGWDESNPLRIYVAKGTYLPKNSPQDGLVDAASPTDRRDKTFLMVKNVQLYGGFDPDGSITDLEHNRIFPASDSNGNQGSILSGDLDEDDGVDGTINGNNAYHVVLSAGDVGNALLDGFTIRGGDARGSNSIKVNNLTNIERNAGGGMYNYTSSPIITNVTIIKNTASSGGGMYNSRPPGQLYSPSSPSLTNVTIIENRAAEYGGGMSNVRNSSPALSHVTISRNKADNGGGMYNASSHPVLTNMTISENEATSKGGGMFNSSSAHAKLTNVIISENKAASGGAVYNFSSSPALTNVKIIDNIASVDGGGMFSISDASPALTNVTISKNTADNGGGIYNSGSTSNPSLYNSIIHGNKKTDDSVNNIENDESKPNFRFSLTEGAFDGSGNWNDNLGTNGGNNIAGDPRFTDSVNGDYTLQAGSPAANAGDNRLYWNMLHDGAPYSNPNPMPDASDPAWGKDLNGDSRIFADRIDMGAYESRIPQAGKVVPTLGVLWKGVPIDPALGIDLVYGDKDAFTINHNNTDGGASPILAFTSGETVLDLANPAAVVATLAGNGILKVSLPATANFEATDNSFEVRVAKKDLQITAKDASKVYGELDPEFDVEYSGFLTGEDEDNLTGSLDFVREQGEAVDKYAITPSGLISTNYAITYSDAKLEITPLLVEVTAEEKSKVYGEQDPILTYVAVPNLDENLPNGEKVAFMGELNRLPGEDVGIYDIEQGTLDNTNYTINFIRANFEITKADPALTGFDNLNKILDDLDFDLVPPTSNSDGLFSYSSSVPDVASVNSNTVSIVGLGTTTITATQAETGNYKEGTISLTLNITEERIKAAATITATAVQTHVYDESVKNVAASLNHNETVLTYSPQQGYSNPGTYTITISAPETANYEAVSTTVTLQINPGDIDGVSFTNNSFDFDGQPHSLAVSGLPQDATVQYTNNDQSAVGVYTVTATISRTHYNDRVLTAVLTIKPVVKATSTITATTVQTHVYDGSVKNAAASLNHNETVLTYSPQQGYSEPGTYSITISSAETVGYHVASRMVQLVIEQGNFNNVVLGSKTVTYNGMAHSLELTNLPQGSTVVYENNGQVDAGTYAITARVSHPNYQEKILTATLTINKTNQQISFKEIGTVDRDVGRILMNVSTSSGLPITVTGDNNLAATVSGNELLIHRLGTVRLTATQEGNNNYEAAAPVSITVRVAATLEEDPIQIHQALSPDGDGINDFLIIEGIENYPDNRFVVLTRNGLKVFEIRGYDNSTQVFEGIGNVGSATGMLPPGTYFYILEYRDKGEKKVKRGWFVLRM